jgi:hypothetical protein
VLPRDQNFVRITQKGPTKICAAEGFLHMSKRVKKRPNFFDEFLYKNFKISEKKFISSFVH